MTSLAVQWLGFCVSTSGDMGSILGQGAKIPRDMEHRQKTQSGLFSGCEVVSRCGFVLHLSND